MAATVVSVINLKGGVGKSTLTMMLAEFLAFRDGKRILIIDMDAQANLSYCMVPPERIQQQNNDGRTTYYIFRNALNGQDVSIERFIATPPLAVSNIARSSMKNYDAPIHMVVSTPSVAQLDEDLLSIWERGQPMPEGIRETLIRSLAPVKERYDYVLIDCPPGLSMFSSSALLVSDFYISPIIPEPLSLQGVQLVQDRAIDLRNRYGATVEFAGTVLNIVKHYRSTHSNTANIVYARDNQLRYRPFQFWLPDNERLRKLGEYDPEIGGDWAAGVERKFPNIYAKYGLSYTLTNPPAGFLSRTSEEGGKYRLQDRITNLTNEFQEKCAMNSKKGAVE